ERADARTTDQEAFVRHPPHFVGVKPVDRLPVEAADAIVKPDDRWGVVRSPIFAPLDSVGPPEAAKPPELAR
ncbi:MAG: hypothetical protein WBQ45_04260, partial [Roseiarcus sp.]